ncbi:MAG: MBL fold metallo-hydrolase [Pseudomonadota bacterium]
MQDPFDKREDAVYATPVDVAPAVRRITCRNPSPYTFTGTQTYLVGTRDLALIDPGPDEPEHLRAILDAVEPGQRISHILVTHSHRDHSPGAALLAGETGADVYAYGAHGAGLSPTMESLVASGADLGGGEGGDHSFQPKHLLADGDVVQGDDWRLGVLHTPGHLSNHISFSLEGAEAGTGTVFTGDTVMGFATTLVSPPDGDMAAFMDSLRLLSGRSDDSLYLPGHGNPVSDPHGMLAYQMAHREGRFDQILAALEDGPATAGALARAIYTEVNPALLPAAARNVLASLIGLADQNRVVCQGPIAADARFALP